MRSSGLTVIPPSIFGSDPGAMLISFVFSFRNEEANLAELARRVDAAMEHVVDARYEMLFVNDNSTDRSLEILRSLQERLPITVINMSRRFGVTPCVLAGLAHAKGDAVIYMDADLQDPPEIVPEMIQRFRGGAEVVHTRRRDRDGETALKMWLTGWAYRAINYFSELELPENMGDFKLLSRKVVDEILKMPEQDPYMRGLSVWVGFRQEFVEYVRQPRFSGRTHFPIFGKGPIMEFLRGLTTFSAGPLYISFFLGLATVFFGGLLVAYALITKLAGISSPGASGVLIAMAIFSGIILMTNGVMGLYIARIYEQVKARPRYVIKDVITRDAVTRARS